MPHLEFRPLIPRPSLVLVLFILCFAAAGPVRGAETPAAVVEGLHQVLLDTMKRAADLGVEGRFRNLQPVLEDSYNFQRMIAIAVGSHWANASEENRSALATAFARFSIATYASRFNAYSGERFETLGERPGPRDSVLIDTRIVRTDGDPVPLTYVFRSGNGRWQIVDVLVEQAISELAVRRSEYAKVLEQGGPPRLIEVLNQRADELLRG
jgi:phospholipid transport system substrate-binding protein